MFPLAQSAFGVCRPVFGFTRSWWRTLDSARMAPKRATTLLLLVTLYTQVILTLCHLVSSYHMCEAGFWGAWSLVCTLLPWWQRCWQEKHG